MSDTPARKRKSADADGAGKPMPFSPRPVSRRKPSRKRSFGAARSPVAWSLASRDRRAETMWAEALRARADGPAGVPAPLAAPRAHLAWWADAAARRDENVLEAVTRFGVPPAKRRDVWLAWSGGAALRAAAPAGATYARFAARYEAATAGARGGGDARDGDGDGERDDDDGAALLARLADAPSTIEKDVPRTCAAMAYFREGDGARALRRVLGALAVASVERGVGCARARARTRPARRITAAPATPRSTPYSRARPRPATGTCRA